MTLPASVFKSISPIHLTFTLIYSEVSTKPDIPTIIIKVSTVKSGRGLIEPNPSSVPPLVFVNFT